MKPTIAMANVVQDEKLICVQNGCQEIITLDTPAWWDWLEDATSFTFRSRAGTFTAHKTRASNGRGGWYWYAYRRQHGHLSNFYLGSSAKLTHERLLEAAQALAVSSDRHTAEALGQSVSLARIYPAVPVDESIWQAPESSSDDERLLPATALPAELATGTHFTTENRLSSIAEPGSAWTFDARSLLATRLSVPHLSTQHVARPHLLDLLEWGVRRPVTLVSAPAGSGKTTLLAEWVAVIDLPVAWISLETSDNDPARFLAYLITALASLDKRIEPVYQPADALVPERALTGILNALTRLLEQEAVLILDDYHVLTTESAHALLRFLLDHLPTRLHLVIGTRVEPPLPLARLRARSQLCEIRTQDLRFGAEEVQALASAMGLAISSEAANLLERRAEGWIAGVQLLALALHRQADAMAFLRRFHGTHRFLLDYVSEEVLAQQTPDMQRFLLRTSILTCMSGPLCEAVTNLPDGQARLVELQRANLFVSALDDTETWYRYHTLFAETLCARLQKLEPELIPELYARASHWYEQHLALEEACEYALLANDFPHAAHVMADLLPRMIEQGRFEQLGHWLEQLPPALIAASPQLYIATPWLSSLKARQHGDIERALKLMEQHVQKQQKATTSWVEPQGVLTLFQALTAMADNNLPRAFSLARKALRVLTTRDTALSQLIVRFLKILLSLMYGVSGDLASAEQMLIDLSLVQSEETLSLVNMAAPFLLGELYKAQGHLHKSEATYLRLLQAIEPEREIPPIPLLISGFSLLNRVALLYEWNRLPEAASAIEQVLEMLPRAIEQVVPRDTQPALLAFALSAQARIAWAQGRPEEARYFLELVRNRPEMSELPPGKEQPIIDVPVLAARLALICGQVEYAFHWEHICGVRFDNMPTTLLAGRQVFIYLTLARVLLTRGRERSDREAISQALILLANWRRLAETLDFQDWLIEIDMLTALALSAQGQLSLALTTLGTTLARAEVEGYIRLFADCGQPMAYLLTRISAYTTVSSGYLQRIQAAILAGQPALLNSPAVPASQFQLDPLSAREREVLVLLATGASNQQIAEHLIISLNTAKRHVKNILAKLAVPNRTHAVARARELGLL